MKEKGGKKEEERMMGKSSGSTNGMIMQSV